MEEKSGIYCVYAGSYDESTKKVELNRLLYVGKADNIQDRIGRDKHEHLEDWKCTLKRGEEIIYTRAFIEDSDDRTRVEAALIYYFQPPINSDGKDGFHHPDTVIETTGANALLESSFVVYRTDN